jgi:transposase
MPGDTSYSPTSDTAGVSDGPTEAMNALIMKVKRVGLGYRNFDTTASGYYWTAASPGRLDPTTPIRGRLPCLAA